MKRFLPALMAILAVAGSCALLAGIAVADPSGLMVSQSGTGLVVRLVNPKDGAAAAHPAYSADAGGCNGQKNPCYIFSAVNGTAPMAVQSDACQVKNVGTLPTAYCAATGVSSIRMIASHGGTIGFDASSDSEMGKHCLPASVTYEAGGGVFSILAHDGCAEKIVCTDTSVGTVDADSKDSVDPKCKFVQRH
jgi:hypothetical protein